MIENRIVFDADMSWCDDVSQISQVKEEMKKVVRFIKSDNYVQLMDHGLFASKHVFDIRRIPGKNFSLIPVLTVSLLELESDKFIDFWTEFQVYLEKIRDHEQLSFKLFLMPDDEYASWEGQPGSMNEWADKIVTVKHNLTGWIYFSSYRVGEWSCNVVVDSQTAPCDMDYEGFSSLGECMDYLVKYSPVRGMISGAKKR